MKIILAHNNFLVSGGAEVFCREVAKSLESHGHLAAFFSAKEGRMDSTWESYFPEVASYASGSLSSRMIGFPRMVYNLDAKRKMAALIRDFKPDLIHVFAIYVKLTPSILDAAREAGVPAVMSCNDYKHICPNYKLYHHGHVCEECKGGRFHRAVLNRCCHGSLAYSVASSIEAYIHHDWLDIYRKNIHTFLFASDFMAKKTKEFWGVDTFRWRMLRNPFDARKYSYSTGCGDYILYFGRLIDEKGVDILIQAMAKNPDVPLVVVGDGPDRNKLGQQVKSLGLSNVQLVGPKWGEELNAILQRCRFVVVPSLWHENFPYVILQSFAFGKPVVGANRGSITELVNHGERGMIYEATDAHALADAIAAMWRSPEQTLSMGSKAKQFADAEFNDEVFYEQLMRIYQEVLEG